MFQEYFANPLKRFVGMGGLALELPHEIEP